MNMGKLPIITAFTIVIFRGLVMKFSGAWRGLNLPVVENENF